jgi:hypothetical protein
MGYGSPHINFNDRNYGLYSEQKVCASLSADGVMDKFANSFLVEISNEEIDNSILYVKINSLRKEKYKLMTLIKRENGEKFAYKISNVASEHIKNMQSDTVMPTGVRNLPAEEVKNGLKYPFLNNKSLAVRLEECRNGDEIKTELKRFFDLYEKTAVVADYATSEFENVFGSEKAEGEFLCINPCNIDLICDNVFLADDGYIIIDNEWTFNFAVPLKFVVWRNINELYYKNPTLSELLQKEALFEYFGITSDNSAVFEKWAKYFAEEYVGNNYLMAYNKSVNQISLMDMYNKAKEKRSFLTSCYYNIGNGFNEEDKVFKMFETDENGSFNIDFDIPENATELRWDIAEGVCLKCHIENIFGDNEPEIYADNAEKDGDFDVFYTDDPHYTIKNFGRKIEIRGKLKYISVSEFLTEYERNGSEMTEKLKIQQDKSTRDRNIDKRYILSCEDRIKNLCKNAVNLNMKIEQYEMEIEMYKNLTQSKAWRFVNAIWRITGVVRKLRGKAD